MTEVKHRFGFSLRPRPPYNFELTVHKPAGWSLFTPHEVFEKGILWTALQIDGMLTGLRLRSRGTTKMPLIRTEVFLPHAPSSLQKNNIIQALVSRLSIYDDIEAFYRFARKDPILKHTVADLYGMHDTFPATLFAEAILAILLQMAPLKRSEEMMDCMIRVFGEEASFDGKRIHVWPSPENIGILNAQKLSKCRLGYRAKHLLKLARVISEEGFPTIEELRELKPEDAKKELLRLPGIGDYSADIINPHGGFPIDAWSAKVFGKLFHGKEPEDGRNAIEKIKAEGVTRWGKYAWMAFLYIVQDLEVLSKKLGISLRLQ